MAPRPARGGGDFARLRWRRSGAGLSWAMIAGAEGARGGRPAPARAGNRDPHRSSHSRAC